MRKLVIVIGGSSSGKTAFAFAQATEDSVVICGDQFQFLDGWSIASGAFEAMIHRHIWKELYLSRKGHSDPPTRDEYFSLVCDVLGKAKDCPTAIIDGMSAEYMPKFTGYEVLCERRVSFIGLRSPPPIVTRERMLKRMERMIARGLISEVMSSVEKFGRYCWMARNSLVVKNALKISGMLDEAVKLATEDKQTALEQFDCIEWRETDK